MGECPGFTGVGGAIAYPEGREVTITNLGSDLIDADCGSGADLYTNNNETNPSCRIWTQVEKICYVTGNLAIFSLTVPEDAAAGTYYVTPDYMQPAK